jgi:multiple sugar transport system permease protein
MNQFVNRFLRIFMYVLLLTGAAFTIIPFLWMLSTSLKSPNEVFTIPIKWIPGTLRFDNYYRAWTSYPFAHFFVNSIIVSAGIIIGQILTSILAAYAFARMEFKGKEILFSILLTGLMIPEQTIMIPVVKFLSSLHWLNTYYGLIIPFAWSALITFLIRQYFAGLPKEVEEASKVDGLGTMGIICLVILPMSAPVISTAVILVFIYAWNQYLWPLLITNEQAMYTVQLGLSSFKEANAIEMDWTALMAGTAITVLPMIVVFILFQRNIIDSIAFSGGKE